MLLFFLGHSLWKRKWSIVRNAGDCEKWILNSVHNGKKLTRKWWERRRITNIVRSERIFHFHSIVWEIELKLSHLETFSCGHKHESNGINSFKSISPETNKNFLLASMWMCTIECDCDRLSAYMNRHCLRNSKRVHCILCKKCATDGKAAQSEFSHRFEHKHE